MKKNHVNSDMKNPLGWFENVIINDLTYQYRDDFYTEAQRLYKDKSLLIDYNDNSITYDFAVSDDGCAHRFRYTYADYFKKMVGTEKDNSIALISSRLNDCTTREEKAITTENILNKLYYLIHLLKKKRSLPIRDFPVIPLSLYEIVTSFENIAHHSLPNPLPGIIEEALNPQLHLFSNLVAESDSPLVPDTPGKTIKNANQTSNTNTGGDKSAIEVRAFKWLNEPSVYTSKLYYILIDLKVIMKEEIDITIFNKAFDGKKIETPLKIKWHLKNKHNSYKVPIIRMMNCLMDDLKLIEKVNTKAQYARKIENIFADSAGNLLNATDVTMQNYSKTPSIIEREMLEKLSILKPKQK